MRIAALDPRLAWYGQVSLENVAGAVRPWRARQEDRPWLEPALATRCGMPAGVRLALRTDSRTFKAHIRQYRDGTPDDARPMVDLAIDGQPWATQTFTETDDTFTFLDLPAGEKRVELWLPMHIGIGLDAITVDDGATLARWEDPRPRWVTYGSSITHCGAARSPCHTWPAIVARRNNWNLTCLGFGGCCYLDPLIACMMRDEPADYLSICAGINIYLTGSLDARTFESSLVGFVRIVREKHPHTPLALISPIWGGERETTLNRVGWTLAQYRQSVADIAERLRAAGDAQVYDIHGLDLFDVSLAHLLPDTLHPNAAGYELMAERFLQHAPSPFA